MLEVKHPEYNGRCVYPEIVCSIRTPGGACHKRHGEKCKEAKRRIEWNREHILDGLFDKDEKTVLIGIRQELECYETENIITLALCKKCDHYRGYDPENIAIACAADKEE